MNDKITTFWAALGALTFAETLAVAEVLRDAWESTPGFEPTDLRDWSFLLNTAREITEDRSADGEPA